MPSLTSRGSVRSRAMRWGVTMCKPISAALLIFLASMAFAQGASSQWQRGTVMAVGTHLYSPGERASDDVQYDVSVKVGNTVYTVLYAPPRGVTSVGYSPGIDLLVLVKPDTLTFNSKLSGETQLPILRKQVFRGEKLDLSKAPSQYFSMKLQHLTEALDLQEEQQKQIRPILEQETADVAPLWGNPALSREEKLSSWERIVAKSDRKIMTLLSTDQMQKLRDMRKQQKAGLKKRLKQRPKEAELR